MRDEQLEIHLVDQWTDHVHWCPFCHSVYVNLKGFMREVEAEGRTYTEADAANAVLMAAIDSAPCDFMIAWVSERHWRMMPLGACTRNAQLAGLQAVTCRGAF